MDWLCLMHLTASKQKCSLRVLSLFKGQSGGVSGCGTPGSGPHSGPGGGPRRMNNKTKDLVSPKSGKSLLKTWELGETCFDQENNLINFYLLFHEFTAFIKAAFQ